MIPLRTPKQFTFTTYLTRGRMEREYEVEVTYSVTPFVAATYMQPAEGGEVEILSTRVLTPGPEAWPVTDYEFDWLHTEACDRADDDLADYAADHADYLYEQYRERVLERVA